MNSPADPVTVVVPNFNGRGVLVRTLDALARQTRPPHRVVVVDNASTDGSVDDLAVEVIRRASNDGFGAAANAGLARCDTPNVAIVNSDARPAPDWLERLAEDGPTGADQWAWGSVLISAAAGTIESAGDFVRPSGRSGKHLGGQPVAVLPSDPYPVLAPPGAAPLLRADVVRSLGGWFEPYFLYYEDLDLALRARLAGYRCHVVPSARVEHDLAGSSAGDPPWEYIARSSTWCAIRSNPSLSMRNLARLYVREFGVARRRGATGPWVRGKLRAMTALGSRFDERRSIMGAATDRDWVPGPPTT